MYLHLIEVKENRDCKDRLEHRAAGSITVFMSLLLMVIASLLFTLLEVSRYQMLGMMAAVNSQSVTESMFAEYIIPAYQNYHLLVMDGGYGTGQLQLSEIQARMQELGQENLNPAVTGIGRYSNFLQMNVTDSSAVRYELATDRNASALLKQMSELMKGETAADLIKHALDIEGSCEQGEKAGKYLDGALDTMEQAKEAALEADSQRDSGIKPKSKRIRSKTGSTPLSDRQETEQEAEEISNPMEDVKSAKSSPLLAQVISGSISSKQIEKADAVWNRALNTGNYESEHASGIIDKLLIIQYLKKYASSYRNSVSVPHALLYEQEYILFGKYSDEENLKKMASRMLLLREGMNFAYLLTDEAKCAEAMTMAAAIAAATGIPGAVKAIQMGILASWAYSESIAELRTLFSGGKIAAVKGRDSWTVSLAEVPAVLLDHSAKSKEISGGLDYQDYIYSFLALESLEKIGNRFANLLEKNLRLYSGYGQVQSDCMITAMETDSRYHAKQMFLSFVTIAQLSKKGYEYQETYAFSYTGGNERQVYQSDFWK